MKRFCLLLLMLLVGSVWLSAAPKKARHIKTKHPPTTHCAADLSSCPPEGCGPGGDAKLNVKKNVVTPPEGNFQVMTFADFLHLEEERPHTWTTGQDRTEVEKLGEDTAVSLTGYLLDVHAGSPETCNCELSGEDNNDFHLNIVEQPTDRQWNSIVVEMTPKMRATKPGWKLDKLSGLIDPQKGPPLVRVRGLLLFDSQHVSRSGGERETIWEIHPVTAFEVCPGGKCTAESDAGWQDTSQ